MTTANTKDNVCDTAPWRHTVSQNVLDQLKLDDIRTAGDLSKYDVAIVGGGVSGLSAAQHCAADGKQVLLLEKHEQLGLGASGINAGIFCAGVNMPFSELVPNSFGAWLWAETLRLQKEYFLLAEKGDSLLKIRKTGALFLARNVTDAEALEHEARAFCSASLPAVLWNAKQVETATSGLLDSSSIESALYLPEDGRVNPLTLIAHLARDARDAGAQLLGSAMVKSYRYVHEDKSWLVQLGDEQTFSCRQLIRATGPLQSPNKRIYAMAFKTEYPDDFPVFQDAAPFTYYDYRSGDGYMVISGGEYGRPESEDAHFFSKMQEETHSWLPGLKGQKPAFHWSANLNVAADMIPTLNRLDGENGFSIDGLGAFGVLPGLRLGQLAAEKLSKS